MAIKRQLTKFDLNGLIWKEGNLFVAKAVEVEVASQGKTREKAIENLEEALDLYLEDMKPPKKKVSRYRNLELIKITPDSERIYA
ncbi:MAG: type II toxin-antitoxin system HicB family antitoxin [Patescibacteria group bacterium]